MDDEPNSSLASRVAFGLAVGGSALVLWGISSPFQELWALIVGGGALLVGTILWLVAVAKAIIDVWGDRGDPRWRWINWSLGVIVLVLVLVMANVPWRARWAHSRPDFAAVAAEARLDVGHDESVEIGGPRQVGTLDVEWIRQQGQATVFATEGERFGPFGVLYLPEGAAMPADIGGTASSVAAMGDGWYWWRAL